jgi:hypothetical protein
MFKFFIAITAYDPLSRFDPLLCALQNYEKLPGSKTVYIYVDKAHEQDVPQTNELIEANIENLDIYFIIAHESYVGFLLTWAHKPDLRSFVKSKAYDFYIYAENDMIFTKENFDYWFRYKDKLKALNLEPGFCRYEIKNSKKIPFDNYFRHNLHGLTQAVWGDRPYGATTYLYLEDPDLLCFVSLGNPYGGLMILDQEQANFYINSDSCDPYKSYALTKHRNWPIADRSSMGVAFENLNPGQEHRRVVPIQSTDYGLTIPDFALVRHLDIKYSKDLPDDSSLITTFSMFE